MKTINALTASLRYKTSKTVLGLVLTFPLALHAQESIECQILRQQIMQLVNSGDPCQQLQNECYALVAAGRAMKSSCDTQVGFCRLGEAAGKSMGVKSELETKIARYKSFCGG